MEITPKKSRVAYESLFPSDEELAMLAETGQFDVLEERLKYKNAEYALKSALEREGNVADLNKDVLVLILVRLDAGQVLDMAMKIPLVQKIIQDHSFWKRKMEHDMPELFVKAAYKDAFDDYGRRIGKVTSIEENLYSVFMEIIQDDAELQSKHKNIYFVLRYCVWKIRKWYMETPTDHITKYLHIRYIPFENTTSWKRQVFRDKKQLGRDIIVPWHTMFTDRNMHILWYLNLFVETNPDDIIIRHNGKDSQMKKAAIYFFNFAIHRLRGTPPAISDYISLDQARSNLKLYFKRGFVAMERGAKVIGQCFSCNMEPIVAVAGCCKQVGYCSEKCAREDWPKHECSKK